jgi:hypothetical protein
LFSSFQILVFTEYCRLPTKDVQLNFTSWFWIFRYGPIWTRNSPKQIVNSCSIYISTAYEYVPDAEIASVAIGTSLVMEQSGSEEDLLTEKVIYWRSIYDAEYGTWCNTMTLSFSLDNYL